MPPTDDDLEENYRADRPWRMLLALYGPEWRALLLGELAYLCKASPVWVMPLVTANLIDLVAQRRPGGLGAVGWNAAVGAAFIVQNVASGYAFAKYTSRAIRNVEQRLRSALVRRLQMLSISYYDKMSAGRLQSKVLRDVESVEQLSRQLVDPAAGATVSILVALGVTAWRMPAFLPVLLLLVPLVAVIRLTMSGRLRRYNAAFRQELENMSAQIIGMIGMIPVTRAHAAEEQEIARAEGRFGRVREAGQSFDQQATLFGATTWVVFMLFNLACFTAAAALTLRGRLSLTPGDIVLLSGYFTTVVSAVMQLNAMLPILTRGFDALRSIGEVLECPDIEENRGKLAVNTVRGAIRFENVSFDFGDAPAGRHSRPALHAIDLTIAAGESIGIVGPSGSGKSTLLSLLIGFHRPSSGRILLDGVEMNTIDLRTYRRHLAVVGQQTLLFAGTLRENIAYGTSGVSEAQLRQAIQSANAAEFIEALPLGLDTEIGEAGARLSGGQRQRIAIARAMIRDPRVLLLDEATSALDAASEAQVQEALERLMAGRTTFMIAHRLHTLRKLDRIVALEKGVLVPTREPPRVAQDFASQAEAGESTASRK